jgi:hypothetical protein
MDRFYFGRLQGCQPVMTEVYYVVTQTNPETKQTNNILVKRETRPKRKFISPLITQAPLLSSNSFSEPLALRMSALARSHAEMVQIISLFRQNLAIDLTLGRWLMRQRHIIAWTV